jgi:nuclear pore complex protein Nup93
MLFCLHDIPCNSHYLLAASGVSPGHALRDLKALEPQTSISLPSKEFEPFDPDNQKYLRTIQQRGRQAMVAESLARAQRDFDLFMEEKVDLDWEEQRHRIFKHFGLSQKDDPAEVSGPSFGRSTRQSNQFRPAANHGVSRRSVLGRSGFEKSVIGTPGTGKSSHQLFDDPMERTDGPNTQSLDLRFLREKMGYYAEKVQSLNSARLQARSFPIFHEFSEVEKHAGGDVSSYILGVDVSWTG